MYWSIHAEGYNSSTHPPLQEVCNYLFIRKWHLSTEEQVYHMGSSEDKTCIRDVWDVW